MEMLVDEILKSGLKEDLESGKEYAELLVEMAKEMYYNKEGNSF